MDAGGTELHGRRVVPSPPRNLLAGRARGARKDAAARGGTVGGDSGLRGRSAAAAAAARGSGEVQSRRGVGRKEREIEIQEKGRGHLHQFDLGGGEGVGRSNHEGVRSSD